MFIYISRNIYSMTKNRNTGGDHHSDPSFQIRKWTTCCYRFRVGPSWLSGSQPDFERASSRLYHSTSFSAWPPAGEHFFYAGRSRGARHKYQDATVRCGTQALPSSCNYFGFGGADKNFMAR
jgi:hypothetical protein